MSLKENVKDKQTTVPGLIIIGASVFIWLASYFLDLKREVNDWYLVIAATFGVVLIMSPKTIVTAFRNRTKNSNESD